MTREEIRAVRRTVFGSSPPLNEKLLALSGSDRRYYNISNPAGQLVFLYLCEYVRTLCTSWFETPIEDIAVLDWGCGNGQVSFLLKEAGAALSSCDRASHGDGVPDYERSAFLENARIAVIPLNHPSALPFDSSSFHTVLSFGVLEHVENDRESLGEIRRILRDRGLFFCFNLPFRGSWIHRLARISGNHYHDRFYDMTAVMELLSSGGFELLDIWHRQLLPKNRIRYPLFRLVERIDQCLTEYTPLRRLSTNIEFVAEKTGTVIGKS